MATKRKSGSTNAKRRVKMARSKPGKPRASVRKAAARGGTKPAKKAGAKVSAKKPGRKRASSPKTVKAPARKPTATKTRKPAKKLALRRTASVKKAGVRKPSRATAPAKKASKPSVAKTTHAKKLPVKAAPKTHGVPIKALGGHVCAIVLDEDCAKDPHKEDLDRAIASFIALEPSALTAVEKHVFRYYLDCKDYFEPGEPGYLEIGNAADVWKHVGFGPEATVGREGNVVYISLGCNCDWEPEHGLQIVFKGGQRVNKVGPFDGHFTNSHAYDDESLEDVIYRPRGGIAPADGA